MTTTTTEALQGLCNTVRAAIPAAHFVGVGGEDSEVVTLHLTLPELELFAATARLFEGTALADERLAALCSFEVDEPVLRLSFYRAAVDDHAAMQLVAAVLINGAAVPD